VIVFAFALVPASAVAVALAFGFGSRRIVSFTCVPGLPRIFRTIFSRPSPTAVSPSTASSLSPLRIPARSAGDPSMGAMTVSTSFRASTSSPTPPNSPSVSLWKSAKSCGAM